MIITQKLAGGISTLESGFSIGLIEAEPHENIDQLPEMLGINPKGQVFAIFMRDRTVKMCRDATRAELEASEGIKYLILGWQ